VVTHTSLVVLTDEMEASARHAIAQLLRSARERAGLSLGEVSETAGVGQAWYGALEKGRELVLSSAVLAWISDALHLTIRQRQKLFSLAGLADPPRAGLARAERAPAALFTTLKAIRVLPTYLTGARLDVLAWNDGADVLYGCDTMPAEERNSLLFLFDRPEARRFVGNWDTQARRAIELLRPSATIGEPWVKGMIERLTLRSADFRRMWASPRSLTDAPTSKEFLRRGFGHLRFEEHVGIFPGGFRMHVHVPADRATREKLERLTSAHLRRKTHVRHALRMRHVQRLRAFIDENHALELRLESLSELVGVEKYQMLRLFATEVGVPPHAYQILVRIERARALLAAGVSSAAAAAEVGFADQSHLTRHFRRLEGMTPATFQRSFASSLGGPAPRRNEVAPSRPRRRQLRSRDEP
jgi:AraC-like DNA-binding protein/transcriptional regulator with XRE-family HTH domain